MQEVDLVIFLKLRLLTKVYVIDYRFKKCNEASFVALPVKAVKQLVSRRERFVN